MWTKKSIEFDYTFPRLRSVKGLARPKKITTNSYCGIEIPLPNITFKTSSFVVKCDEGSHHYLGEAEVIT